MTLYFVIPPLAFLLAGLGVGDILPVVRSKPLVPRLGIAYLLGLASVGGLLYGASHLLGLALRRRTVVAVLVLCLLPAVIRRMRRWRAFAAVPSPEDPGRTGPVRLARVVPWVVATVISLAALALLARSATTPVSDWDGRMIWGAHARYILDAGTVDPPVFLDARWIVVHPQYPVLLPVLQVASWQLLGTTDERVPKPIYAAVFPAILAILYDAVRRSAGRILAGMLVLVLAFTPKIGFDDHGGAAGSYSDLPLAAFLGTGLLVLLGSRRDPSAEILGGLFLAAAVLTKNEGMPLAALGVLVASLRPSPHKSPNRSSRFLMAARIPLLAVTCAALFIGHWQRGIPNRIDEAYPESLSLNALIHGMRDRFPHLLALIVQQMRDPETWGYVWWLVPLLLLPGVYALKRPRPRLLLLFVLGACGLYFSAYAITGWTLESIVHTTWNRFLLQILLPTFALVGACTGSAVRSTHGRRPVPRRLQWGPATLTAIALAAALVAAQYLRTHPRPRVALAFSASAQRSQVAPKST